MRKRLLALPLALGLLSLPKSMMAAGDNGNSRTFTLRVPHDGSYCCGMWMMPATFSDGSRAKYDVSLNGSSVGSITPQKDGWQSVGMDDGQLLSLKKGDNVLTITSSGGDVPEVECIRLGGTCSDVQFDAEDYEAYIDKAKRMAAETAYGNTPDNHYVSSSDISVCSDNDGNTLLVDTEIPLKYSFYKVYSFDEGQSVHLSTASAMPHAVDVFYVGKEKTPTPITGIQNADTYSFTDGSQPFNKDKFTLLHEPASSDEMQGLSWKRISTDEKGEPYTDFFIMIPKSGYYMIKLRSLYDEALGTADISIYATKKASSPNFSPLPVYVELGTFKDAPIYYSRADFVIPSNVEELAVMTRSEEDGDPMLFVEGNAGRRIVGYNDDADADYKNTYSLGSLDSYIEQVYKVATSDVHIVNTSSLSPETKCRVVYGFKSDLVSVSQKQKMAALSGVCGIEPSSLKDVVDANGWKRVEVFDVNGKKVFANNSGTVSLPSLPSGFYIVKVLLEDGKFNIYKINIK